MPNFRKMSLGLEQLVMGSTVVVGSDPSIWMDKGQNKSQFLPKLFRFIMKNPSTG